MANSTRTRLTQNECFVENKHIRVFHQHIDSSELHSHEFFEIEFVLQGEGINTFNTKKYPIQRGSVWISTPADFHEFSLGPNADYWTIIFDESLVSSEYIHALISSGTICKNLSEDQLLRFEAIVRVISEESKCGGVLTPLLEYLLAKLISPKEGTDNLTPIKQAILYIDTFFRNSPSLADVAAHVGLSPTYFGNLFKKEVGETYVNYLTRRKITCATLLLAKEDIPIATVCYEAGFGSLSGFMNAFKKATGLSPSNYKKSLEQGNTTHNQQEGHNVYGHDESEV